MAASSGKKTQIGTRELHPETQMLNYGYDPRLSEGAVKPPVFLTSTFVFNSAEEGKEFFDFVAGRQQPPAGKSGGLVYSRFNHPNSEIVEQFLIAVGVSEDTARRDAEGIEHYVSESTLAAFARFLEHRTVPSS